MESNIAGHAAFHDGLERFGKFTYETTPEYVFAVYLCLCGCLISCETLIRLSRMSHNSWDIRNVIIS
jgi:hypothetical protein